MRVLLTGATGFLGRYLLDQLTRQKINTVVVGRARPMGFAGDFMEADLLRQNVCGTVIAHAGATHLMHLAWYVEHGMFWSSPLNLRWVESTVQLVEAFLASGGGKVVVSGTCAEYDLSSGYCREDVSLLAPATLYGTAKDVTRRLVTAICEAKNVPCAWGRIFFPYGPGENSKRLIPSLISVFKGERQPFGVNAVAYRDCLHAEDVARGFMKLLCTDAEGSFNISSGQPTQIADVVRLIANRFHGDPNSILELATARPGDPEVIFGDNQKLKSLGWRQNYDIGDIASAWGL